MYSELRFARASFSLIGVEDVDDVDHVDDEGPRHQPEARTLALDVTVWVRQKYDGQGRLLVAYNAADRRKLSHVIV